MTTATKNEVEIIATSTPNFFYAKSSDGVNVYGLIYTGPGAAICSCVGCEVYGKNCKHRQALLAQHIYLDPQITLRLSQLEQDLNELNETIWQAIQARADDEADRYAAEELWAA